MKSIWMAIAAGTTRTRLLAMRGADEVILKAHLAPSPSSPSALRHLLEAIALWEGREVRAALIADGAGAIHHPQFLGGFPPGDHTPLYSVEWVLRDRTAVPDEIDGMGDFEELRALLATEVAR